MLRVDGLRVPFRRKQEEVNDAKKSASKALNSAEYSKIMCDVEIKAVELKQEELIKSLTAAADVANAKVSVGVNERQISLQEKGLFPTENFPRWKSNFRRKSR